MAETYVWNTRNYGQVFTTTGNMQQTFTNKDFWSLSEAYIMSLWNCDNIYTYPIVSQMSKFKCAHSQLTVIVISFRNLNVTFGHGLGTVSVTVGDFQD